MLGLVTWNSHAKLGRFVRMRPVFQSHISRGERWVTFHSLTNSAALSIFLHDNSDLSLNSHSSYALWCNPDAGKIYGRIIVTVSLLLLAAINWSISLSPTYIRLLSITRSYPYPTHFTPRCVRLYCVCIPATVNVHPSTHNGSLILCTDIERSGT